MFIVMVFIESGGNSLGYPMFETFSNFKKIRWSTKKIKQQLEKAHEDTVVYGGLVATLEFNHSFPLRPDFWDPSDASNLNRDIRMMAFLDMFKGPRQFYWVAITPQSYDDKTKKWQFTNWLPLKISSTDQQIEALIKSSDQYVLPKANSIGLYTVVSIQGLDIETGELFEPKSTDPATQANC